MDKNKFIADFTQQLSQCFGVQPKNASSQQIHHAVGNVVMSDISSDWKNSVEKHLNSRRACYFSMEFLVGRAVFNNILCRGIYSEVEESLESCGISLSDLEDIEDSALGNGGLGRLAACFLDSAATLNLPLDGYGIRYKYGLFKQSIVDGFQVEEADDWTKYGDAWSKRCDADRVLIEYNGQTLKDRKSVV